MTPEQAKSTLVKAIPDLNIEGIAEANQHNAAEELNAISTRISEFAAKYPLVTKAKQ